MLSVAKVDPDLEGGLGVGADSSVSNASVSPAEGTGSQQVINRKSSAELVAPPPPRHLERHLIINHHIIIISGHHRRASIDLHPLRQHG
ncbi:hypothetical protein Tco_1575360 [Tanacetum coccineum]